MWVALELTATNDGPLPTPACAARRPSRAERPVSPPELSPAADSIFASLVVPPRPRHRAGSAFALAATAHAAVAATLILLPLYSATPPPASPDYIRALIYDPAPPPPPPLPKGSRLVPERPRPKLKTPAPPADERAVPALQAPVETAAAPRLDSASPATATEPSGSPNGADSGVPEGMEEGVEGGMVGGVPGGVLGGVIGGTGHGVVRDYDLAPRLLRQTKPRYPQEAFVKKIEGTVLVEFVIDAEGRVVSARILRSVPSLDQAALDAVREWSFAPAFKHGVPVATVARAPVVFRIF